LAEYVQREGLVGGERGIRTLDTVSRIHAFQACALNHSAISPHAGELGAPPAGKKARRF
jgi:hypothetical protein